MLTLLAFALEKVYQLLLKQLQHKFQKSLSEALLDYELLKMNDYGKVPRHKTLHLAFQALHNFVKKEQRLPHSWCQVSEGYNLIQPIID